MWLRKTKPDNSSVIYTKGVALSFPRHSMYLIMLPAELQMAEHNCISYL